VGKSGWGLVGKGGGCSTVAQGSEQPPATHPLGGTQVTPTLMYEWCESVWGLVFQI